MLRIARAHILTLQNTSESHAFARGIARHEKAVVPEADARNGGTRESLREDFVIYKSSDYDYYLVVARNITESHRSEQTLMTALKTINDQK